MSQTSILDSEDLSALNLDHLRQEDSNFPALCNTISSSEEHTTNDILFHLSPSLSSSTKAVSQLGRQESSQDKSFEPSLKSLQQSEAGFVTVSPFEDPLSMEISSSEESKLQRPLLASLAHSDPRGFSNISVNSAVDNFEVLTAPQQESNDSKPISWTNMTLINPPSHNSSRLSSSSSSSTPGTTSNRAYTPNPTLSFFDQFAQDSRNRSTKSRSSLVDEILLHEDDPMYFLKDEGKDGEPVPKNILEAPSSFVDDPLSPASLPLHKSGTSTPLPSLVDEQLFSTSPVSTPLSSSLAWSLSTSSQPESSHKSSTPRRPTLDSDIDVEKDLILDYFRFSPREPLAHVGEVRSPERTPVPLPRTPGRGPRRSASIPVPEPTLAPPITSPSLENSDIDVRAQSHSPSRMLTGSPTASNLLSSRRTSSKDENRPSDEEAWPGLGLTRSSMIGIPRSSSYQTLSGSSLTSLPGKWVTTLLRNANPGGGGVGTTNNGQSLESIFSEGADEPEHDPSQKRNASMPGSRRPRGPHIQNHQATQPLPTFTHSSPFGSPMVSSSSMSVKYNPSPFAPHIYVPPTGAPGYKGEGYRWDKGFSDELEVERKKAREEEIERDSLRGRKSGHMKSRTESDLPTAGGARREEPEADHDVHKRSKHEASRSGSHRWGSSFGLPFGTVRGKSGSNFQTDALPAHITSHANVKGVTKLSVSPSNSFGSAASGSSGSRDSRSRTQERFSHNESLSGEHDFEDERNGAEASDEDGVVRRDIQKGKGAGIGAFIERKTGNVELVGRKGATIPVLTTQLADLLRPNFPALSRLPRSWTLIYSLDQDGISLNTLYTRCAAHMSHRTSIAANSIGMNNNAMLVVMKDAEGAIFGAWLAEGIKLNKGGYYGGGESFLYKYENNDSFKVFKCTGKNKCIALCEPEIISFGGGDGHYGLYLDDSLFDGSSAPCPTFDNDPLCSPGPKKGATVTFECVGLEVWGMAS